MDVGNVSGLGVVPRPFDTFSIGINAHHFGYNRAKTPGKRTLAAAHVKRASTLRRDGIEDHPIIVKVSVPSFGVVGHGGIIFLSQAMRVKPSRAIPAVPSVADRLLRGDAGPSRWLESAEDQTRVWAGHVSHSFTSRPAFPSATKPT